MDLTDRQVNVLRLIKKGLKNEEIGQELYISLHTVKSHVKAIYSKIDLDDKRAIYSWRQRNPQTTHLVKKFPALAFSKVFKRFRLLDLH